MSTLAI
jgi:hypothetical protein